MSLLELLIHSWDESSVKFMDHNYSFPYFRLFLNYDHSLYWEKAFEFHIIPFVCFSFGFLSRKYMVSLPMMAQPKVLAGSKDDAIACLVWRGSWTQTPCKNLKGSCLMLSSLEWHKALSEFDSWENIMLPCRVTPVKLYSIYFKKFHKIEIFLCL